MKNVITFFVLIFLLMSVGYAQITKPAIVKETKELRSDKGISELLNAGAIRTWKISPQTPKHDKLSMYYFNGQQFENTWFIHKYYSDLYTGSQDWVPLSIKPLVQGHYDTSFDSGGGLIAPMILKFFASNGTYRIKFKVENAQAKDRKIAVVIDNTIKYVKLSTINEFVFVFAEKRIKPVKIAIGVFGPTVGVVRWKQFIKISEIQVDQIAN